MGWVFARVPPGPSNDSHGDSSPSEWAPFSNLKEANNDLGECSNFVLQSIHVHICEYCWYQSWSVCGVLNAPWNNMEDNIPDLDFLWRDGCLTEHCCCLCLCQVMSHHAGGMVGTLYLYFLVRSCLITLTTYLISISSGGMVASQNSVFVFAFFLSPHHKFNLKLPDLDVLWRDGCTYSYLISISSGGMIALTLTWSRYPLEEWSPHRTSHQPPAPTLWRLVQETVWGFKSFLTCGVRCEQCINISQ